MLRIGKKKKNMDINIFYMNHLEIYEKVFYQIKFPERHSKLK